MGLWCGFSGCAWSPAVIPDSCRDVPWLRELHAAFSALKLTWLLYKTPALSGQVGFIAGKYILHGSAMQMISPGLILKPLGVCRIKTPEKLV